MDREPPERNEIREATVTRSGLSFGQQVGR